MLWLLATLFLPSNIITSSLLWILLWFDFYIFSLFACYLNFFILNSPLFWLFHLFSLFERQIMTLRHSTFTTFWRVNFTQMLWSRLTSTHLYFAFLLLWWLKVYCYKDTKNNPKKTSSITHLWIFTSFHDVYSFILFKFL